MCAPLRIVETFTAWVAPASSDAGDGRQFAGRRAEEQDNEDSIVLQLWIGGGRSRPRCRNCGWHARLEAQTSGTPERFTALAANTNNGGTAQIEIAVDRWSTPAERARLVETLRGKGPDKLLSVLQSMPKVGFLRQTSSIGWDLRYAHKEAIPDGGGERVVVATDRPIGNWEAVNQPRTIDYPFTFIELRVDKNGEGEGKMSIATKIIMDSEANIVTLEHYEISPVRLTNVKRETVSR